MPVTSGGSKSFSPNQPTSTLPQRSLIVVQRLGSQRIFGLTEFGLQHEATSGLRACDVRGCAISSALCRPSFLPFLPVRTMTFGRLITRRGDALCVDSAAPRASLAHNCHVLTTAWPSCLRLVYGRSWSPFVALNGARARYAVEKTR